MLVVSLGEHRRWRRCQRRCRRRAVDCRPGPVDVVCGLPDGLRRLRNRGQSDAGVRQGALTTCRNSFNAFTRSCAACAWRRSVLARSRPAFAVLRIRARSVALVVASCWRAPLNAAAGVVGRRNPRLCLAETINELDQQLARALGQRDDL